MFPRTSCSIATGSTNLCAGWLALVVAAVVAVVAPAARAQPTGACCNGTGCMLTTFAICTGSGRVFIGGACSAGRCDSTMVTCCGGSDCVIISATQCALGGEQAITGACEPNPCPGRCCNGGSCTYVSQAQCSGTWFRAASCSPNLCAASCCVAGTCTMAHQTACNSIGGTWAAAATCSPNPCLAVCCSGGGACLMSLQDNCTGTFVTGAVACSPNPCPLPQCDLDVFENFGGLTTAVATVIGNGLLVARGTTLELLDLTNPSVPAAFNPPRRIALPAPAVKIVSSPGSSRAFIELENDDVAYVTIVTSPTLQVIDPQFINELDTVDIAADGDRVFIATHNLHTGNNRVRMFERGADGAPDQVGSITPFLNNFAVDHIAKIGNVLWLGMHEINSNVFGIEGWNVSNPGAPSRTTSSLNFAPLGSRTELSAMHPIGNKLLISYDTTDVNFDREDWMRAADVTNPASPLWHPAVDLNGFAGCMSSTGNLLRVAIRNSGIGTWDTTNPASLTWLGAHGDTSLDVRQMIADANNDYLAVGRGGWMTMSFSNPASPQFRSQLTSLPAWAQTVRQLGSTTAVIDASFAQLRVFDYTLPESQQLRSSVGLTGAPVAMELTRINTGSTLLACVAVGNGSQMSIFDITNPTAPALRTTFPVSTHLMSATNSRLYVLTNGEELKVFDLSNPASPNLLSTTPFGGVQTDYTCMTSWESGGVKAVALGTGPFGLWFIDATQGSSPQVVDVHNPGSGYFVHALARGSQYLYVSSSGPAFRTRLESLTYSNLTNPTVAYETALGVGAGEPGQFDGLGYVSGPTGKFLVGTRFDSNFEYVGNDLVVFDLNGPLGEAPLHRIFPLEVPYAGSSIATSSNGSSVLVSANEAGLYQIVMPQSWAPGFSSPSAFEEFPVCLGGSVTMSVNASASPGGAAITYQWFRNGNPIVALADGPTPWGSSISGATTPDLTIHGVRVSDAARTYSCVATNSCGPRTAVPVVVGLCAADFNCSGAITVQDIFDFLAAFFSGSPLADFNDSGTLSVQDLFDFLAAYFAGCP